MKWLKRFDLVSVLKSRESQFEPQNEHLKFKLVWIDFYRSPDTKIR